MIKALIIDWYGVCGERQQDVWISELRHVDPDAIKKAFKAHLDEWVLMNISGLEFQKRVFHDLGLDHKGYEHLITKLGKINWDLLKALSKIKKEYKIILLSDNMDELVPLIEAELGGFDGYFDMVVLSNFIKKIKNDPETYRIVMKDAGVKTSECIFIDDRDRNIEVARKLGIDTIKFDSNEKLWEELGKRKIVIPAS